MTIQCLDAPPYCPTCAGSRLRQRVGEAVRRVGGHDQRLVPRRREPHGQRRRQAGLADAALPGDHQILSLRARGDVLEHGGRLHRWRVRGRDSHDRLLSPLRRRARCLLPGCAATASAAAALAVPAAERAILRAENSVSTHNVTECGKINHSLVVCGQIEHCMAERVGTCPWRARLPERIDASAGTLCRGRGPLAA